MILADTSIWAEFFRQRRPAFAQALEQGVIILHPVVIGELAMGNLPRRAETLHLLQAMPRAAMASFAECLEMVQREHLFGMGIGWSDAQILASVRLADVQLWTLDKPLRKAALHLAIPLHE